MGQNRGGTGAGGGIGGRMSLAMGYSRCPPESPPHKLRLATFIGLKLKFSTMFVAVTSTLPIQPGFRVTAPIFPSVRSNAQVMSSSMSS